MYLYTSILLLGLLPTLIVNLYLGFRVYNTATCNFNIKPHILRPKMIKKRTRPQPRVREISTEAEDKPDEENGEDDQLPYVLK